MTSTNTELLVSLLYADFISFKHMPRSGVLFCFFIHVEIRGKSSLKIEGTRKEEKLWNRILGCDGLDLIVKWWDLEPP